MISLLWGEINHIDNVRPIDDEDLPCLNEIFEILKKHNCIDRFGVALLHKHFDLQEDEVGVWGAMEPKTNVSLTTSAQSLLPRQFPRLIFRTFRKYCLRQCASELMWPNTTI
uniref:Uncharacterized protein n=3 Tax=Gammaproteobacteria TaxID=1236 RepID=A0A7L9EHS5_PSEAI|nr:hypothetical protein [Pseudomonas aeruginosa]